MKQLAKTVKTKIKFISGQNSSRMDHIVQAVVTNDTEEKFPRLIQRRQEKLSRLLYRVFRLKVQVRNQFFGNPDQLRLQPSPKEKELFSQMDQFYQKDCDKSKDFYSIKIVGSPL